MWHQLGECMAEHHRCRLKALQMQELAQNFDAMFKRHTMPNKCLDMEPMKKYSLKIDVNFRDAFGDRAAHLRPDLPCHDTAQLTQICELDREIVGIDWKDLLEKQAEALLRNLCLKQ
ncbi:unnamed protein product [Prorocentrum cordatum]|uniref:Uncharacterized protein n=1 Tax=Prorocentrum cordatum TaxID=2364126 RepID=A0ABN9TU48_9DINO|nr:unnamed protein product [Polarella glacialis]|mmetsp:Transcript_40752/g.109345  ORF Transcript_40752/g.109345 Transcript_40752/m.109345 type:complete len:117 (+) Transcript_40752:68-418(+)